MALYDVGAPVLQLDFGAALGAAKEATSGVFTREFQRATVTLNCGTWASTFALKGKKLH